MPAQRKCGVWIGVAVVVHGLLSISSETYGGVVGIPIAAVIAAAYGAITGKPAIAEYHLARVLDFVPAALVIDGLLIIAIGCLFCLLRHRSRP